MILKSVSGPLITFLSCGDRYIIVLNQGKLRKKFCDFSKNCRKSFINIVGQIYQTPDNMSLKMEWFDECPNPKCSYPKDFHWWNEYDLDLKYYSLLQCMKRVLCEKCNIDLEQRLISGIEIDKIYNNAAEMLKKRGDVSFKLKP